MELQHRHLDARQIDEGAACVGLAWEVCAVVVHHRIGARALEGFEVDWVQRLVAARERRRQARGRDRLMACLALKVARVGRIAVLVFEFSEFANEAL